MHPERQRCSVRALSRAPPLLHATPHMSATPLLYAHHVPRYGMRMGFDMRQQAIAAVQAKVLRLNAVAVADQTAGKVGAA